MGYLVGTDEAGYGPNLGPLVVSATVWQVPGDPCETDLYVALRDVVTATPGRRTGIGRRGQASISQNGANGQCEARRQNHGAARRQNHGEARRQNHCAPLVLADSKVVYKPADGLANLEFGLLSALAWAGRRPKTWREVWHALDSEGFERVQSLPWHDGYDRSLACDGAAIDRQCEDLQSGADAAGVRLVSIRSRAVFPELWNERLDQHLNKSTVLSLVTLDLLADVLETLDGGPVMVICDKHGGRNSYRPLLQRLTEALVEVGSEGRDESLYGWGRGAQRVDVAFRAKAERFLPAALASMASKYLRELAMDAFNEFWRRQVPGLTSTAGYPVDAARFKADIGPAQRALGIDDRILWRVR